MLNLHARELERILVERKLTIEKKTDCLWAITSDTGKVVNYAPETGKCWIRVPGTDSIQREQLRGSAMRVAEIIQEMGR
jgi:hypothetical protein